MYTIVSCRTRICRTSKLAAQVSAAHESAAQVLQHSMQQAKLSFLVNTILVPHFFLRGKRSFTCEVYTNAAQVGPRSVIGNVGRHLCSLSGDCFFGPTLFGWTFFGSFLSLCVSFFLTQKLYVVYFFSEEKKQERRLVFFFKNLSGVVYLPLEKVRPKSRRLFGVHFVVTLYFFLKSILLERSKGATLLFLKCTTTKCYAFGYTS